ncbi:alpha/beta hydrolase [Hyphococcus luteus]|nr:alpha/beta hydrolase fold domain-containing protein [Marinicaulis flavus]
MTTILDRIAEIGFEFSPALVQKSIALFAPTAPSPNEKRVLRDCAYGPDARHRLDIFLPEGGNEKRGVVVFVHGGGFIGGDKGAPGAPFYNNIGAWAAANGMIGVTMTYRLAPDHPWPAGAEDVAAAIDWLHAHVAEHGGDPDMVYLMGQSAGAAHVAAYVAHDAWREHAERRLAGAIMLSGLYDIARAERNAFQAAYYGEDDGDYASRSSLEGFAKVSVPCFFTMAEHDPADFQRQAEWARGVYARNHGGSCGFAVCKGHNHITPVLQIGGPHDELGPVLLNFINR